MAKEVVIDRDECTSCGQCADDLPDVFAMDDDDIAIVVEGHSGSEDDIQEEIDACPGECILWKD